MNRELEYAVQSLDLKTKFGYHSDFENLTLPFTDKALRMLAELHLETDMPLWYFLETLVRNAYVSDIRGWK